MIEFLRRAFSRKQLVGSSVKYTGGGRAVSMPREYDSYAREGYQKNVVAFRCIDLISGSVASIPWLLYQKAKRGQEKVQIETHEILTLLDNPNPMQGSQEFFKAVASYLILSGNSYIRGVGAKAGGGGKPLELYPLMPTRMKVVPGAGSVPAAYEYKVTGREPVVIPVDRMGRSSVLHLKTFHPADDWYGMSPLEAAALHIDQLNAGGLWHLSLMQNSCRPSGAFIVEGEPLDPNQRQQLQKDIEEKHMGPSKAGRWMLLEGGMKYVELGKDPVDMDFLNTSKMSEKDVALALGVPSQLVGVEDSQKFDNYAMARLAFFEDTVLPLMDLIKTNLNRWLLPSFAADGLELAYDKDCIDALAPKRDLLWDRAQKTSFLTENEKRLLVGYDEYEPGADNPADRLFVTSSSIPIELAVEDLTAEPLTDDGDVPRGTEEDPPTEDVPPVEDPPADEEPEKALTPIEQKAAKRRNAWKKQERVRLSHERRMESQVKAQFKREASLMGAAFRGVHADLAEYVVHGVLAKQHDDWKRIVAVNVRQTMLEFGEAMLKRGKSLGSAEEKGPSDKFRRFVDHFVDLYTEKPVDQIQRTTRKRLLSKIRDAIKENALLETSVELDLGSVAEEAYKAWTDARSATIARTETHMAAQEGSRAAAKALGIPNLKKIWNAANDDRTRDWHANMDGVEIELNEKFEVAGPTVTDLIDGPGDPQASAENIFNCRCALTYSGGVSDEE